jgi:alcohol dehydrogenase class IV
LFSAFYRGGIPAEALQAANATDKLVFCDELYAELARILGSKADIPSQEIRAALAALHKIAFHVTLPNTLHGACRDAKDDFVLECALTAGAPLWSAATKTSSPLTNSAASASLPRASTSKKTHRLRPANLQPAPQLLHNAVN